jgi:hypothetical protein
MSGVFSSTFVPSAFYPEVRRYIKTLRLSANVVDVFLYDTSKDSDEGAWRWRCQDKSWYTESLNTTTRGNKREFPAIALIVAETDKVTIFDATVVGCPMWMVFNQYVPNMLGGTTGTIKSCTALNGILYSCLSKISFLADSALLYGSSSKYSYSGTIAARNSESNFADSGAPTLVNSTVNDAAMCVIPGAPTDGITGLPVPTIAVATAGGVSIIDGYAGVGTIVDQVFTGIAIVKVSIKDNNIFWNSLNALFTAPLANYLVDYTNGTLSNHETNYSGKAYYSVTGANTIPALLKNESGVISLGPRAGGPNGLTLLKEDRTTFANGMAAHVTKDYNTGWMQGDIRRALICAAEGTTDTLAGGTLADRSVKASVLTVNGSLERAPVATGAELQRFGPLSAVNYLSQAYSADLDFGVGNFHICGWVNSFPTGASQTILERYPSPVRSGSGILLYVDGINRFWFFITNNGFGSFDQVRSISSCVYGTWARFDFVRRGANLELWFNAVKEVELTITETASLSNATAKLRVGLACDDSFPFNSAYASLLRMGVGAPSAQQILEAYLTEKEMFLPGAKCTLQGSSNIVTCLDYDATRDKVLAGTSDGITAFEDLVVDPLYYQNAGSMKAISAGTNGIGVGTTTEAKYKTL